MDEPNRAASRILAGTGFGLFLVAGFGLIEGRSQWDSFSMGHIFVILGILCAVLSRLILNNNSPLGGIFPNESDEQLRKRVADEINEVNSNLALGSAWAELETKVLEQEFADEQE